METPAEARRCPVRGCENEKDVKHVVCESCWAKIPAAEKTALHKAWAKRKKLLGDEDANPGFRHAAADAHRAAVQAAIAAAERGGG